MPKPNRGNVLRANIGFSPLGDGKLAEAPTRILLLNDGDLQWEDLSGYKMTAEMAEAVIKEYQEHGTQLPVDYEHMTIDVDQKGGKAPAAGWITKLSWVPNEGLYADVEWTAQAKVEIESGQYKYHSPVIITNSKTKEITRLHSVALTNTPRTRNQRELMAASLRMKVFGSEDGVETMDLTKLKAALVAAGVILDEKAEDDAILTATCGFVEQAAKRAGTFAASLRTKLGLDDKADETVIVAKLDDLRKETVPASEYKAVTDRLAAIESKDKDRESQMLVASAIESAKLNPNDDKQMIWARGYAKTDPLGFAKWVEATPVLYSGGRLITPNKETDGGDDRASVIAGSVKEHADNASLFRGVQRWAYVNSELTMRGLEPLSIEERKKL
jgi:phage I-like protein